MKWNASPQDFASIMVLITLYIWMDKGVRPATETELAEIVGKANVGVGRLRLVISELQEMAFTADANEGGDYKITPAGTRWMEENFTIHKGQRYQFQPKRRVLALRGLERELQRSGLADFLQIDQVNWTKWGAIAAFAAIPVAIFIAWYFNAQTH